MLLGSRSDQLNALRINNYRLAAHLSMCPLPRQEGCCISHREVQCVYGCQDRLVTIRIHLILLHACEAIKLRYIMRSRWSRCPSGMHGQSQTHYPRGLLAPRGSVPRWQSTKTSPRTLPSPAGKISGKFAKRHCPTQYCGIILPRKKLSRSKF